MPVSRFWRGAAGKIFREAVLVEFLAVTGGSVAGLLLASLTGLLEAVPGLLLVLPAFLNTRGEVFASLGARLSTKLHLGFIRPTLRLEPPVLEDVAAYLVLSALRVAILVLVGFLLSLPLGRAVAISLVFGILGLAVLISAGILIPLTLLVTFRSFSRGYDPENVVGPLLTSSADVLSFLSIIIAAAILGV